MKYTAFALEFALDQRLHLALKMIAKVLAYVGLALTYQELEGRTRVKIEEREPYESASNPWQDVVGW